MNMNKYGYSLKRKELREFTQRCLTQKSSHVIN